jgi:hypothetical protein
MKKQADFKLEGNEKNSRLWIKINAHWSRQLEQLRLQLEGDKNEIQTAKIRGRIQEIKFNLALSDKSPNTGHEDFAASDIETADGNSD